MVIDNIANCEKYYSLHPEFKAVFEALKGYTPETPAVKNVINGDTAFINYSTYTNKPVGECKFESHKKYIDIQFVVKGREFIDVCDTKGLTFTEDNLENGDIAFYEDPECFSTADLSDGDFVILFPGEAHRPLVAPKDVPTVTSKAVAKIIL